MRGRALPRLQLPGAGRASAGNKNCGGNPNGPRAAGDSTAASHALRPCDNGHFPERFLIPLRVGLQLLVARYAGGRLTPASMLHCKVPQACRSARGSSEAGVRKRPGRSETHREAQPAKVRGCLRASSSSVGGPRASPIDATTSIAQRPRQVASDPSSRMATWHDTGSRTSWPSAQHDHPWKHSLHNPWPNRDAVSASGRVAGGGEVGSRLAC
jgi:hypothetical protein